jgi:hypothetical protein
MLFLQKKNDRKNGTFDGARIPTEFFVMKSCVNVGMTVLIPCSENRIKIIRYPLFSITQDSGSQPF